MKQIFEIRKKEKAWLDRVLEITLPYIISILLLTIICMVTSFFEGGSFPLSLVIFVSMVALPLIAFVIIWQLIETKHFLTEFLSDGKKVEVGFLSKNKGRRKVWDIEDIEVEIRKILTRASQHFELRLHTNDESFILRKENNWKYEEMRDLFVYVMDAKGEKYHWSEKGILKDLDKELHMS